MTYDYIIIGAGAAGLQLADALGRNPFFKERKILLLDKDPKRTNDRTWCFWEKGNGAFDVIVRYNWSQIHFGGNTFAKKVSIGPYRYKMIRGMDFYSFYMDRLRTYPNVTFLEDTVTDIKDIGKKVIVTTKNSVFYGNQAFNSLFDIKRVSDQKKYPLLQQHFVGWFIRTEQPVFDVEQATFMDFSVPQKNNTRFMYVLPFSKTEALVEYTLFSEHLLPEKEYEAAIEAYLKTKLNCTDYVVLEREKGAIPMTCFDFAAQNTDNMLHIGTAGGWTKASTGYTFLNTFKKTNSLVAHLAAGKDLRAFPKKNKFRCYDLLFLDVLHRDNGSGHLVFESMFRRKSPQLILKFLDEETTIWEDMQIISACPKIGFVKAFFRRLYRSLN